VHRFTLSPHEQALHAPAVDDRGDTEGGEMSEPIQFDATIAKVQTLVDYGLRITLDLPDSAIIAAAQLMTVKRENGILHIIAQADIQPKTEEKLERATLPTRTERKSIR
jgi:hypothetical protein